MSLGARASATSSSAEHDVPLDAPAHATHAPPDDALDVEAPPLGVPRAKQAPRPSMSLSEGGVPLARMDARSDGDVDVRGPTSDFVRARRIRQWVARVTEARAEGEPGGTSTRAPSALRGMTPRPAASTAAADVSSSSPSEGSGVGSGSARGTTSPSSGRRSTAAMRRLRPPAIPALVDRVSTRLRTHVPTVLWQLAYGRIVRPWTSPGDEGVWLLGEYYGPDAAREGAADWHAALDAHVARLVSCTYRRDFAPIARSGRIGAEENTAQTVAAGAEALSTSATAPSHASVSSSAAVRPSHTRHASLPDPPLPAAALAPPASGSTSSPAPAAAPDDVGAAAQVLPSYDALASVASVHQYLVERLEHLGWQLPLPLRPGTDHTPLLLDARLVQGTLDALRRHSTLVGLPGVWGAVHALYARALSLTQPASGLTTDAGWGCMLRTVQSLLANAVVRVACAPDAPRAACARVVSYFLDDPSRECAFSVQRLVAEGTRLGMAVGAWYAPGTAAAAAVRLVHAYPACGIGAVASQDGVLHLDSIVAASVAPGASAPWTRPVLLLVTQRVGLSAVPRAYAHALKQLFTLPQCVGVAGGRPSASLYLVGIQGDEVLYLDPHEVQPSVAFRHPPPSLLGHDALLDAWYARAYAPAELATFFPARLAAMPVSALDPSLVMGLLVRSADDLDDLQARGAALATPLWAWEAQAPSWAPSDSASSASSVGSASPGAADDVSSSRDGWTVA